MTADFSWRKVSLSYLEKITDDFGIWQHTNGHEVAAEHGYALDDSARALIVAVLYRRWDLAKVYLQYLKRSVLPDGRIINFFNADREPIGEKLGSEDAIAQAYWAVSLVCGMCEKICERSIDHTEDPYGGELREGVDCGELLAMSSALQEIFVKRIKQFTSLRGNCYALLGVMIGERDGDLAGSRAVLSNRQEPQRTLSQKLKERLVGRSLISDDWPWPEDTLTYANAIYPWALLMAGEVEKGLKCLRFLNSVCRENDIPCVIGNRGWYPRGGTKARFDQQPIDVAYLIMANQEAYTVSKDEYFKRQAWFYFSWFWGNNIGNYLMILDDNSVLDGFGDGWVSPNRGAENVVCYLWAQYYLSSSGRL